MVWINSVAAWRALLALGPHRVPRVLHVHELEYVIRRVGPPPGQLATLAESFIVASEAVRDNLLHRHGTAPGRVTVVRLCVPKVLESEVLRGRSAAVRRKLGLGDRDVVVVGCGVGEPRKGVDLLPAIHAQLGTAAFPTVTLLWIGRIEDDLRELLLLEASKRAVGAQLRFLGEMDDPREVFTAADVFNSPSREEPLGMVCLEAAQCGLPSVCFAEAGGAQEFVGDDAGIVVPYLDVSAFAGAVRRLVEEPLLRREMGERARYKVDEGFTVEVAAPRVLEVIARTVVEQTA